MSIISLEESLRFATLSGDVNPIHVNPVEARRFRFGGTVVHGVHVLMRVMDDYLSTATSRKRLISLRAKFRAPIMTGAVWTSEATESAGGSVSITVHVAEKTVQELSFEFGATRSGTESILNAEPSRNAAASEVEFDTVSDGAVDLGLPHDLLRQMFPYAETALPIRQLASIIATSYLVGMQCPGLNSIFAELALDFAPIDPTEPDELSYTVEKADARFQRVTLQLRGPSVSGRLTAFFRSPPVVQPTLVEIKKRVAPDLFEGQRTLVVGGSRGLGEVLAKVIVAGGGEVAITYNSGAVDARRVAHEIAAAGGVCHVAHLDVEGSFEEFARALPADWSPTSVYYFSTPHIGLNRGSWDQRLFVQFCAYYVRGFLKVAESIEVHCPRGSRTRKYVYPSTVHVAETPPGLFEYAAAKAAGEVAARRLAGKRNGPSVVIERLTKLLTDQTGAGEESSLPSVIDAMLALARRVGDVAMES